MVEWTRTLGSGRQERGRSYLHPEMCDKIVLGDLHFEGMDQTVKL